MRRTRPSRATKRNEQGQAAVELALTLPLVAVLLLVLGQVAVLGRDQLLVVHAAREGARAAAVEPDSRVARRAVLAGSPLAPRLVRVDIVRQGPLVRVTVLHQTRVFVPLIRGIVPGITVSGRVSMQIED